MIHFSRTLQKLLTGFLALLFFVGLFGIAKGWRDLTGGFRQSKIFMEIPFREEMEKPSEEILSMLDQPFHYLSQGCQTYVFESADKNYVLKFIRYRRFEPSFWSAILQEWNIDRENREKKDRGKKRNLKRALQSYYFAYQFLKDQTGTIYVHLDDSGYFLKPLILRNIFGISQEVDLNRCGFILQKKASPFVEILLKCRRQNHIERAKSFVTSFLDSAIAIQKKGFMNRDYNCIKNCGIIEEQVKVIDVGSFALFEERDFEEKLRHFTKYFYKWAKHHYPEMIPFFERSLSEKIREACESK